jgi:hypothetical protein
MAVFTKNTRRFTPENLDKNLDKPFFTEYPKRNPCVTLCYARLYQVPPVELEPTTL